MPTHNDHDDFGGLHRDLIATGAAMDRRQLLRVAARFGATIGALQLFGCGSATAAETLTGGTTGEAGACSKIPEETAGPFPGEGSNGPNVLNQTGVVRNDIRPSFAGLSGTADGIPLSIVLTIVSATTCTPLASRAVYLWHCDRLGRYSLYSSGATNQNYLRGVQEADANGKVKRLTTESESEEGLAWSPDGREIWYAAAEAGTFGERMVLLAVTPDGKSRKVFQVPGNAVVWDIAADGRLLFSHENIGSAQMVASPASAPERNVSVLGFANGGSISSDGKSVAFCESGAGTPDDYLVFLRRLDDSAAVEIGEGGMLGMTPDGKYVIALVPSQPTKLRILATGAGETRTFDVAPLQVDNGFVSWMPGAREFVFSGHQGEGRARAYRVSLDGGAVRPLTEQKGAQLWNRVSPDGKLVVQAADLDTDWGQDVIVDLGTGRVRPAPLLKGEAPVGWDQDGRHIFVVREGDEAATVFRVDAFTGRREVWKQIRPADPAGILSLSDFFVTPSGNAYSYSATRILSDLFVYSQK